MFFNDKSCSTWSDKNVGNFFFDSMLSFERMTSFIFFVFPMVNHAPQISFYEMCIMLKVIQNSQTNTLEKIFFTLCFISHVWYNFSRHLTIFHLMYLLFAFSRSMSFYDIFNKIKVLSRVCRITSFIAAVILSFFNHPQNDGYKMTNSLSKNWHILSMAVKSELHKTYT